MRLSIASFFAVVAIVVTSIARPSAEPVAVRYVEGLTHGFLSLKTMEGKLLGSGDLIQTVRGTRVNSRLLLRYRDGSISDETTVFSQQKQFLMLTDRLIQKGPSFKTPLEATLDRSRGLVTVKYTDDKGEQKVEEEKMEFPEDLANGILMPLTKNFIKGPIPKSVSVIAITPKPMLVKVKFTNAGLEPFTFAGARRQATHFVLHVDIGGLKGLAAKIFGKQPPDSHIWIADGEAPAFVRAATPMATGDPLSVIELSGPVYHGGNPPEN
jgi:hypothetical protein